jgi:predicted RNase H-like nuclease (RuvC/YqgF family)
VIDSTYWAREKYDALERERDSLREKLQAAERENERLETEADAFSEAACGAVNTSAAIEWCKRLAAENERLRQDSAFQALNADGLREMLEQARAEGYEQGKRDARRGCGCPVCLDWSRPAKDPTP